MTDEIVGTKIGVGQRFSQAGKRLPVTEILITQAAELQPGDLVKITGTSKGKGFAGVVKRWGFKGGPKTHGQSDRQRAPGAIGQTTTPGRVYRGKRMAGRTGGGKITISGLTVVDYEKEKRIALIKGVVPGPRKGKLIIKKYGTDKKFVPLLKVGEKLS